MKLVFLTLTAFLFTVIAKLDPADHHQKVRGLSSVTRSVSSK